jgi:predicted TPR repeat methyltransferase
MSGRLTAARRLEFALACLQQKDFAAAAEASTAATAADDSLAEAWFVLGEARQGEGDAPAAVTAYRRYLAAEPEDRLGAGARLAILGAEPTPTQLPPAYLRALYQEYAPRFEQSLTAGLGYRGPALIDEALGETRDLRVLDLGCGTGLLAPVLRPRARHLEGVDLSPAMLARARQRGLYDTLHEGDALAFLSGQAPESRDLAAAADLLPYLGDLQPALSGIAAVLVRGGRFVATLERHDGPQDYLLAPTQRFRHSADYVQRLLQSAGLRAERLDPVVARQEAGQPVPGLLVVAAK